MIMVAFLIAQIMTFSFLRWFLQS